MVLLIELEQLQREAADGHQRFAVMQSAAIRAQFATRPPQCPACGDAAVLQVAERLRSSKTTRGRYDRMLWIGVN